MNRIRRFASWTLLGLWLALPLAADETPADLVKQLTEKDATTRVKAIAKLRELGESAREVLEGFVKPGARPAQRALTEEQSAEVARLIGELDANSYKARESATIALIKIGKPATKQLEAAAKSEKPEVSMRAKRVLAKLYPSPADETEGPGALIEAAMILGHVGNRKSIPALRHVLFGEKTSANLAESAAYALREITGGGPDIAALRWKTDRAKVLKAWAAYLDTAAPKGDAAELKLDYPKGRKLGVTERTSFTVEVDMSKMAGQIPGARTGKMKIMGTVTGVYTLEIGAEEPLQITRRFTEHKQEMKTTGGGMGAPAGRELPSWAGKALTLEFGEGDKIKGTLDDADLGAGDLRGPLSLGHVLPLNLPGGKYEVGQRKLLTQGQLRRLGGVVFRTSGRGQKEMLDAAGSARYVGRDGGSDRWFVSLKVVYPEGRGALSMTMQGLMVVDPARGVMVRHQLGGLMWQSAKTGGSPMADMVGEVRFSCVEKTAKAAEKKE